MTDGVFREIAVKVRRNARQQIKSATRGVLDDGGRLIAGRGNLAGVWQPGDGGTGHDQGAEPPLGNPATDGELLSSTVAGVRSWVAAGTFDPDTTIIPAGDCHAAGTLVALLDDLFCRLSALEALTGGYGLGSYGTAPYGE